MRMIGIGSISTSYIGLVRLTNLYKWIEFDQNVIRVTSANWLKPGPDFVPLAPPHRLPDDHVPVVALVAHHGLVAQRREPGVAVLRVPDNPSVSL